MTDPSSFNSRRRTTDRIDELVDGLRIRQGGPVIEEEIRFGPRPVRPRRPQQPYGFRVIGLVVLAFVMGGAFGAARGRAESSEPRPARPTVTRTVTTTTTQPVVPASCRRVFDLIERMMAANGAIADACEKQLDIAHAARRAIFSKDWKALDEAMHRQTELNNSLDGPNANAVGLYAELKDAMKECSDDLR